MTEPRGDLWTIEVAAERLGVATSTIKVWIHRGMPVAHRRPTLVWSHDAYDWQYDRRRSAPTRDDNGRFAQRITPL